MAGQTLTLTIASQLQKAGFTEAAEHMRVLQKEIEGTTKKTGEWEGAVNKLKAAFEFAAVLAFFKSAVDEASNAEQSQLKLKTTVENTGIAWDKSKAKVNAFTQALAESSRFAKGDLDTSLSILIQRTNSLSVAQANLQTVMGISVATGRGLADVSDQIGRAANGSQRDVMQLAKEFGITGDKARDAAFVLGVLKEKMAGISTNEHTATASLAKLGNAFNDFKESIGHGLISGLEKIEDVLTGLIKAFTAFGHAIDGIIFSLYFLATRDLVKAGQAFDQFLNSGLDIINAFEKIPEKVAAAGPLVTASATEMSESLKSILLQLETDTGNIMAQAMGNKIEQMQALYDAERHQMVNNKDFEIADAADKLEILWAMEQNYQAKKRKAQKETYVEWAKFAGQAYATMAHGVAKALNGEKDAWKESLKAVIDMIAQKAEGALLVYTAEQVGEHLVAEDYAGAAKAAAIGAIEIAAIAGLAETAKSAIGGGGGGGGSVSPGGASGGWGTSTPTAAPAAAAARPSSALSVNIYGDLYGEPAFVDRLAMKISEAVENRDVRMVSTTTVS